MIDPFRFGPWVSDEASGLFRKSAQDAPPSGDLSAFRHHYDSYNQRQLDEALANYSVQIADRVIDGVQTYAVEPADGARDGRQLICLHGGAFMWGSGAGALLEAVPVAATTGMHVLAVDYRLAPEHIFPAAVE